MADKRPIDFTPLTSGQVTLDTQFYTQRPGGGLSDGNYRGMLSQILELFKSNGLVLIQGGPYVDDVEAAAAGVAVGEWYELAINNSYGIPVGNGGVPKKRME